MKFTDGFEKLDADFLKKGIPTDSPGFCDHPGFLAEEKIAPSFLNNYAAYVATRPYSPEYLQHARKVISNASTLLHQELKKNGRLGACVDISGIFSRILEKEGIWSCGIKGSLTITFPTKSKEEKTYFWSVDHGEFIAGHAWLYAPPFSIVDIAVKLQPYSGKKRAYIPSIVLSEEISPTDIEVDDIVSPTAREELSFHGVPESRFLDETAPQLKDINKVFPAYNINGINKAVLKYCPVAIHLSDAPLEQMRNMEFSGKTPFEMYNELLKGNL